MATKKTAANIVVTHVVTLNTKSEEHLSLSLDADGDVCFEWTDGLMYMSREEAQALVAAAQKAGIL